MKPANQMQMKVGPKLYPINSFAEASAMFAKARDASGMGASEIPTPLIFDGAKQVAYVSYNGRVWEGSPQTWSKTSKMLYESR